MNFLPKPKGSVNTCTGKIFWGGGSAGSKIVKNYLKIGHFTYSAGGLTDSAGGKSPAAGGQDHTCTWGFGRVLTPRSRFTPSRIGLTPSKIGKMTDF